MRGRQATRVPREDGHVHRHGHEGGHQQQGESARTPQPTPGGPGRGLIRDDSRRPRFFLAKRNTTEGDKGKEEPTGEQWKMTLGNVRYRLASYTGLLVFPMRCAVGFLPTGSVSGWLRRGAPKTFQSNNRLALHRRKVSPPPVLALWRVPVRWSARLSGQSVAAGHSALQHVQARCSCGACFIPPTSRQQPTASRGETDRPHPVVRMS